MAPRRTPTMTERVHQRGALVRLTFEQQLLLCEAARTEKLTVAELIEWAKDNPTICAAISESTVRRILAR